MKTTCELCKCLNLIAEGRKHPSRTLWITLTNKYKMILAKDPKALASFCEYTHRTPSYCERDLKAVGQFIDEAFVEVGIYLNLLELDIANIVLRRKGMPVGVGT